MNEKTRADVALVNRGLCISREKAQAAIMAGLVYANEKKIIKASDSVTPDTNLVLRNPVIPYVSRGALKLEKAIRVFQAKLNEQVIMDIGSSTGGFTDICLKNGAKKVYAIDVGYGQLDWTLRNDPRVCVMERTNARYLRKEMFDPIPNITVMDVSFISIQLILPVAAFIMGEKGLFFTLIKPQFEAGRENVGKKGVVRDPAVHLQVIQKIITYCESIKWRMDALDYSPITGPEGNIEFIAKIQHHNYSQRQIPIDNDMIKQVVANAHQFHRHHTE